MYIYICTLPLSLAVLVPYIPLDFLQIAAYGLTINFINSVKYNCSHQIYHDRMAYNGLIPKNKVLLTIVTRMSSSGCPRRRGICGLYRRFRQNSSASTLQQESVQGSLYFWSILSSNGRMFENFLYC